MEDEEWKGRCWGGEKTSIWKRMSNRVEAATICSHQSVSKWEDSGEGWWGDDEEMMRSVEHQLLSDSESVVCCATSEVGVWRRLADFLPLGPLGVHECVVPPGWAGPPYNTIRGQGWRVSSSSSPPPLLSFLTLTLCIPLSPPRAQSQTREQRHVYVQRNDGHTPTLRTSWAPPKAKTNCCDYISNIVPFSQNPHPYITYICYSGRTYRGLLST